MPGRLVPPSKRPASPIGENDQRDGDGTQTHPATVSGGPVRSGVVVAVDPRGITLVAEIGPVVLVEARRDLELILREVHDEALVRLVDLDRAPRQREQLVAHAEEAA